MLSTPVKFSADNILKYFSYFIQKTGFDIVSNGINLHEISNPVFEGKNKKNVINLLPAELAHRVEKVKNNLIWDKVINNCITAIDEKYFK